MKYYLLLNGDVKGPFSLAMVREMLQAGAIQDMTLMAEEGGNAWKPVGPFLEEHPNDSGINGGAAMSGYTNAPTAEPKWYASRNARIAAVLILGLGIWASRGGDGETKKESIATNEEAATLPENQFERQSVSRAIHELYMQGYNNPAAAEFSRQMLSSNPNRGNTEGGMKDKLIVLGADDRLEGFPVRLVVK